MMNREGALKAIKELSELAKRKPLKGNDAERATELCKKLREMGYSNEQVSELSDGAWSERTLKRWTAGTRVKDPTPKQNIEKLLLELVERGISLDWVQQAVSIHETLAANDLELQDVSELLSEGEKRALGQRSS